jgi:hypothetical protein
MKKRIVHISADYIFQNAYPWWREKKLTFNTGTTYTRKIGIE